MKIVQFHITSQTSSLELLTLLCIIRSILIQIFKTWRHIDKFKRMKVMNMHVELKHHIAFRPVYQIVTLSMKIQEQNIALLNHFIPKQQKQHSGLKALSHLLVGSTSECQTETSTGSNKVSRNLLSPVCHSSSRVTVKGRPVAQSFVWLCMVREYRRWERSTLATKSASQDWQDRDWTWCCAPF